MKKKTKNNLIKLELKLDTHFHYDIKEENETWLEVEVIWEEEEIVREMHMIAELYKYFPYNLEENIEMREEIEVKGEEVVREMQIIAELYVHLPYDLEENIDTWEENEVKVDELVREKKRDDLVSQTIKIVRHFFLLDKILCFCCVYYKQAGKLKRPRHEPANHDNNGGIGSNLKSIIIVAVLMLLMMFVVHCTWVTSNAYSSPSIVLAFYSGQDG